MLFRSWSTWADSPEEREIRLFDRRLVEAVLTGADVEPVLQSIIAEPEYVSDAPHLEIVWLPIGTRFTVTEHDGSETIITTDDLIFTA